MTKILSILRQNIKEYITILVALFMQSYFGYKMIKIITLISHYDSFLNDNIVKIILTCLGFIAGSAIILFMIYIYLKTREDRPLLKMLKYLFFYIIVQVIVSTIMGLLTLHLNNETIVNYISDVLQYLFRYLFILYVFIKSEKIRIKKIKDKVILGFIVTLLSLVLNTTISNSILSIFIEVIYYLILILIFNIISCEKGENK